jgi:hypothetical protein
MKRLTSLWIVLALALPTATQAAVRLQGTVYDYYGRVHIPNVRVLAIEATGADNTIYETRTRPDGSYSLGVPTGSYYLAANPNDGGTTYIPQYYGGVNSIYYATLVQATDGDVSDLNFYLVAGFRLSGELQLDGQPAAGDLYLYDAVSAYTFGGLLAPAVPESGGSFTANVPQGIYSCLFYPESGDYPGERAAVPVNADVEGIQLTAVADAGVSGTVYTAAGDPLQYPLVTVIDELNGFYYGYVQGDENGAYSVDYLPPGRSYIIWANSSFESQEAAQARFYPSAVDPLDAEAITLASGENRTNLDITLGTGGATISGRVTDLNGSPIQGAMVYDFYISDRLGSITPYAQRVAYTNENGEYTLSGLAPTTLGVAAYHADYVPQIWNLHDQTTTLDVADPIDLGPDDSKADVDFWLRYAGDLGDPPVITSIYPHVVHPGSRPTIVLSGSGFDAFARVELLQETAIHVNGAPITIRSVQIGGTSSIRVDLDVPADAEEGPCYIAVTNPDGQYDYQGIVVLAPQPQPDVGITAAPHKLSGAYHTVWVDIVNWTGSGIAADLYLGALLPDGSALFYDGASFTDTLTPLVPNLSLTPDFYLPLTNIFGFEIPTSAGAGTISWFIALLDPADSSLISLDMADVSL